MVYCQHRPAIVLSYCKLEILRVTHQCQNVTKTGMQNQRLIHASRLLVQLGGGAGVGLHIKSLLAELFVPLNNASALVAYTRETIN